MRKIKGILPPILLLTLLIYTRFINLSWGQPYPFHPDERNMAVALHQLNCQSLSNIKECFNPHFFAYGQFPLYLGLFLARLSQFINGRFGIPITVEEATIILRLISALASIGTVYFGIKIVEILKGSKFLAVLLFIFCAGLIQFAHFGTTESLLMMFYTAITFYSLKLFKDKKILNSKFLILNSIFCGLAVATKVSSIIFLVIPAVALLARINFKQPAKILRIFMSGLGFIILTAAIGIIFSPHNLINYNDFISALRYESDVALGRSEVFYTRQFVSTIPVVFQFIKIFPYAFGVPVLVFFIGGFLFLPYNKINNLLRFSFLIFFLPSAFLFTKWTRFMTPIFPLMIIFAAILLTKFYNRSKTLLFRALFLIFFILLLIPGISYLAIYQNPDVRFTASEWIYKNVPENSYLLFETANVVDIPFQTTPKTLPKNYRGISFNFYDLDRDERLQRELLLHLDRADYIFIPSRRVFKNHPKDKYPILNKYYGNLFSGKLGFKKVAEFSSYPRIEFFGKKLIEFPDEEAEEAWTVFDHPVIRIYRRTKAVL
jgi:hypothetical protein